MLWWLCMWLRRWFMEKVSIEYHKPLIMTRKKKTWAIWNLSSKFEPDWIEIKNSMNEQKNEPNRIYFTDLNGFRAVSVRLKTTFKGDNKHLIYIKCLLWSKTNDLYLIGLLSLEKSAVYIFRQRSFLYRIQ